MSSRAKRTTTTKKDDTKTTKSTATAATTTTKRTPKSKTTTPKATIAKKATTSKAKSVATSVADALSSPSKATKPTTKTPKTIKDAILAIVKSQNKPIGLATIKKLLISDYEYKQSGPFNSNVNKTLKALIAEKRDDFGLYGSGSYIAGKSVSKDEIAAREAAEEAAHADDYQCPWCHAWNSKEAGELGEDSIARGSKYRCPNCRGIYWSWISDGYEYAHDVEYKYGDGYY